MNITFPYKVDYEQTTSLTLVEIAEAFVANEKLIVKAAALIEEVFDGLNISKAEIQLRSLNYGSLKQEFLVAIVLAFQQDIQESVSVFIENLLGVDVPQEYEWALSLFVLLIVLYGARYIYQKVNPSKEPSAIQGDYNTVVNLTARTVKVTPEQLEKAVQKVMPPKAQVGLTGPIAKFFRPAKKGGASPITLPGTPGVSTEAVREFPAEADIERIEDSFIENYPDTLVEIRAVDRDKNVRGWAARLPEVAEVAGRLPMRLYPTIEPELVATHERIRADVAVEFRSQGDGEPAPKLIHLIAVRGPA